jgi:hypothetical protein
VLNPTVGVTPSWLIDAERTSNPPTRVLIPVEGTRGYAGQQNQDIQQHEVL